MELATEFYRKLYKGDKGNTINIKYGDNNKETVLPILEDEVEKAISNLKKEKAPGPDGIDGEIVKFLNESLTPILATLLNMTIERGEIPERWETVERRIIKRRENSSRELPSN